MSRYYIYLILVFMFMLVACSTTTVQTVGIAPIIKDDVLGAQKSALYEAKKQAVEQGKGTHISANESVSFSVLKKSDIDGSIDGILKYDILEEKITQEGLSKFYYVKIKAHVKKETEEDDDYIDTNKNPHYYKRNNQSVQNLFYITYLNLTPEKKNLKELFPTLQGGSIGFTYKEYIELALDYSYNPNTEKMISGYYKANQITDLAFIIGVHLFTFSLPYCDISFMAGGRMAKLALDTNEETYVGNNSFLTSCNLNIYLTKNKTFGIYTAFQKTFFANLSDYNIVKLGICIPWTNNE